MLTINSLVKSYGSLTATDNLTFQVNEGEFHSVIGPNGAGKTTLIRQITGETKPDSGKILFNGIDISKFPVHMRAQCGIARSFQITNIFLEMVVIENVSLAIQAQLGHSFHFWKKAQGDPDLYEPALGFLDRVGLKHSAMKMANELSHGEQRQLEIAIALGTNPKMLILDEPTAGMSASETESMMAILERLKGRLTILLIEHDMNVVFKLADKITVLSNGKLIASDSPDLIRNYPEVQNAYLGNRNNEFGT